jgi:renalase
LQVLIIGAGMAGLSAAQEFVKMGHQVIVLDKGRGVGGRMSTRTIMTPDPQKGNIDSIAKADHGAQYFSSKSSDFQEFVADFTQQGIIKSWQLAQRDFLRYVGTNGMNTIPKKMTENLTVLTNEKVIKIEGKQVFTESGKIYEPDTLILTMPAPQVLELFQQSNIQLNSSEKESLQSIHYAPCFAVLAVLKEPTTIKSGGLILEDSPISWIADNFQKGITKIPTATIHASPEFSEENLEGDILQIGELLLKSSTEWISPENIVSYQTHRWRYSLAQKRVEQPYLEITNLSLPILCGGDGFGIGNIEGAFISGKTMAKRFMIQL